MAGEGLVVYGRNAGLSGFETLTHARIRAAQGDRSGARRIARSILERDPGDRGARDLLEALGASGDLPAVEPEEPTPDVPVSAAPQDLRASFRARLGLDAPGDPRAALTAWLGRIRENRGRTP